MTVSERLLARDGQLPQRELLLDDGALSALLSTSGDPSGSALRFRRVRTKYRFGTSLRTLYRSERKISGEPVLVSMRTFSRGHGPQQYDNAAARARQIPCLAPSGQLVGLDTVYWRFPNDRKLGGLAELRDGTGALAESLGRSCRPEFVAYAPEKSATARCLGDANEILAYAKLYANPEETESALRAASLQEPLAAEAGLRLPRLLSARTDDRLLVFEALAGAPFSSLRGEVAFRAMRGLGASLAEFHALKAPTTALPFARNGIPRLTTAAAVIAQARPDLHAAASRLCDQLAANAPTEAAADVSLHGDLHPKNVLWDGQRVSIIDLDQVASGPAVCDLASFIAAAVTADIAEWPFPGGIPGVHAFLEGYGTTGRLPSPEALRWHTAAALLAERALRAVNRIRPRTLARLDRLLDAANATLQGAYDA